MTCWAVSSRDRDSHETRFVIADTRERALGMAEENIIAGEYDVIVWTAHKFAKPSAVFEDPQ
jgi:hypothetical protein